MNAIIKIALEAKGFKKEMIENILELAEATGNSTVAIEVLLGVYVEPEFPRASTVAHNAVFDYYNKFTEEVWYLYDRPITKAGYFPAGTKREDVTMENFDELSDNNIKDYVYHSIPTGKFSKESRSTSIEQWVRKAVKEEFALAE